MFDDDDNINDEMFKNIKNKGVSCKTLQPYNYMMKGKVVEKSRGMERMREIRKVEEQDENYERPRKVLSPLR